MSVASLLLAVVALASVMYAWVRVLVIEKELANIRQAQRKPMDAFKVRLDKLEKGLASAERSLEAIRQHSRHPVAPPQAAPSAPVPPPQQAVPPRAAPSDPVSPPQPAPASQAAAPSDPVPPLQPAIALSPGSSLPSVAADTKKSSGNDQFINFDCLHCRQNIDAPITMVGEKVPCPTCAILLAIPRKSSAGIMYQQETTAGGASTSQGFIDVMDDAAKDKTVRIDISHMNLTPSPKIRKITVKRRTP